MPSELPPDGYQRNWTAEGIEKLRKTIQKNRPWEQSTEPRTPEGKAIVQQNFGNTLGSVGTAVPEPTSACLLTLAGLGAMARRRWVSA